MRLYSYAFFVLLAGCVTGGKDNKDGKDKPDNVETKAKAEEDDFYNLSGNLETFTVSLSNNPLLSKRIDRREASAFAAKLETAIKSSKGDDRKAMVSLMSLRRIAGEGLSPVMEVARQLVSFEMKKNVNHGIPEFAKVELVLAAIQSKKYSYAEYFIDELITSKNKKIRAAAFTAAGLIAAQDDRLPEAVESWSKALDVVPDFEPALLNIGFVALKYGDFQRAKKMLGGMQGDWFAAYGLATAERMSKEHAKASDICKRVLAAQPRYKPALYNCALNAYEGEKNYDEALGLLDKMTKIAGNTSFDDKAYKLKQEIEREAAKHRAPAKDEDKKKK